AEAPARSERDGLSAQRVDHPPVVSGRATAPATLAMWRIARPETGVPARLMCSAISLAVAVPSRPITARTTSAVTAAGVTRPLADARAPRPRPCGCAVRPRPRVDAAAAAVRPR